MRRERRAERRGEWRTHGAHGAFAAAAFVAFAGAAKPELKRCKANLQPTQLVLLVILEGLAHRYL